MAICSACNSILLTSQKRIKCSNTSCGHHYHVECVKFPNDSSVSRSKWVCPVCTSQRPKGGDNSNTPVHTKATKASSELMTKDTQSSPDPSSADSHNIIESQNTHYFMLDSIKAEMSKMKNALETSFKNYIREEISPLRSEIQEIKTSINFINGRYEEVSKRLELVESKLGTVASSKGEMKEVNSVLLNLQSGIHLREQWARRSNIEIIGIPEKKGENLVETFCKLAEKAKFPINPDTDIDFITRVAPKNSDGKKCKPIVVRFLARYKKDDCLSCLRKLRYLKAKDIGFMDNNQSIYFNDHLTSSNKQLLQQAKNHVKDHNYKYIWVKHCCILVRRDDVSPILQISSTEDLKKIK